MTADIREIILTVDQEEKPVDYKNLNTDVIVRFSDGDSYIATFFSHESLKEILDFDIESGECFLEHYYRILDMVLVKDFNRGNLLPVIEGMIAEGDFQLVFKKI